MHWAGGVADPPGQTPPRADTPHQTSPHQTPWADTPCAVHAGIHTLLPSTCWNTHNPTQWMLRYTPPAQCMLGYTLPPHPNGHCSRRYASDSNAFLLWFGFYGFSQLNLFWEVTSFTFRKAFNLKVQERRFTFTFNKTFVQTTRGNDKFQHLSVSLKHFEKQQHVRSKNRLLSTS